MLYALAASSSLKSDTEILTKLSSQLNSGLFHLVHDRFKADFRRIPVFGGDIAAVRGAYRDIRSGNDMV